MEFTQEVVTTLHDFGQVTADATLDDVGVVVPVAGDDVGRESVRRTLRVVAEHRPGTLVVPVRGDRIQAVQVAGILDGLRADAVVLWCNAPAVSSLLDARGIDATGTKGLDVWLGLAIASANREVVAVHDADATSYSPEHLPKLVWPIDRGSTFVKGYYARVEDDRLYGRLTRLLWAPLVAAIAADHAAPVVTYLQAFRYPLAGEFAASARAARSVRVPRGWGLEAGILGEMFSVADADGSAQVDLGYHAHDHRPLRGPDGLYPMARSVAGTLLHLVESHGPSVDPHRIAASYHEQAISMVGQYAADAAFNDLRYDRTEELGQVERYRTAIEGSTAPAWLPPLADAGPDPATLREAASIEAPVELDIRGDAS